MVILALITYLASPVLAQGAGNTSQSTISLEGGTNETSPGPGTPASPPSSDSAATRQAIVKAIEKQDDVNAESLIKEAVKKYPQDRDLRVIAGQFSLREHSERARAATEMLLRDSVSLFGQQWLPDTAQGSGSSDMFLVSLTGAYDKLNHGEATKATTILDEAIAKTPTAAPLYYARTLAHAMNGKWDKADADSKAAVSLSGQAVPTLSQRARLLMTMGNRADAYAFATQALLKNPNDADALAISGRYLWRDSQRPDLAIEKLKLAAAINPKYYQALYDVALIKYRGQRAIQNATAGELQAASDDASFVLSKDSQDASAHLVRGIVSYKKGDAKKTIIETSLALKSDPTLGFALVQRGLAYEASGQHGLAVKDLTAAVKINAKYKTIYDKIARK